MKRAALYARVSTDGQREEATIKSQIEEIRQQIKRDENAVAAECEYVDDGYTGAILNRPALDRLRDAARQGHFEVLYVYDRGRLSRKFAHQELLIDELQESGVEFITLHDAKAETPE